MLVMRIFTGPPLESLGTTVVMAYCPVGALLEAGGLVIKTNPIKRGELNKISIISSVFNLHELHYK